MNKTEKELIEKLVKLRNKAWKKSGEYGNLVGTLEFKNKETREKVLNLEAKAEHYGLGIAYNYVIKMLEL